ncbi:uncharacterized protein Z520_10729 [Fonsecaea multimorphosa CBS 102226]|uniref:DUF7923 domain-containing protein n=1 Tax=Fonsecaea multimorphosa CBS 102226 TaxID=1442371 RepID=A0A0D2I8N1_9EURO|nr:uncharacterized protein Z520_10729 [Fonsecaea multimorphosa CBS 102226]KIX93551.1 hypothetical protein Z520_10729 [Fonsecaea multimorphosa CBS 102226]OAL18866.1 hypothetical protein AYO22_10195 [Fonsecaea multimorphosa]
MPFFPWLSPFKSKTCVSESHDTHTTNLATVDSVNPIESMDFDTLADKVEALRSEQEYAYELCNQANLQFDKYRIELYELRKLLKSAHERGAKVDRLLVEEQQKNAILQAQLRSLQNSLRNGSVLASQLQARLNAETAALKNMTKHARKLEEKLIDMQLDLEYLKCTTSPEPLKDPLVTAAQDFPLPAQPFVVVLVDGDAYFWAPDIGIVGAGQGGSSTATYADATGPGAIAATRIRNEVVKYILHQNGTIPITSKVVTRVFLNYGSGARLGMLQSRRRSTPTGVDVADFAVQFTEKVPLFDFFDAGRGKERADDKIRENFHLFLSTPNCRAIFVAACLDNGFARMLEQYSDHPVARQKIVLVSPGYVAIEIQKLGLKTVEWPSVFAVQTMPANAVAKHKKEMQKLQKQRAARVQRSASTPATTSGDTRSSLAPQLLDLVPAWDPNIAMSKVSNGVGFRVQRAAADVVARLDLAQMVETAEDID